MRNSSEQTTSPRIDWPVVLFFLLAYILAWGTLAIFGWLARGADMGTGVELMAMTESMEFQGREDDLGAPVWLLYLLSRVADFSFTIAGIVAVATTAGRAGLWSLFKKLFQWKVGRRWYAVAMLPFVFYGLAAALTASGDMNIRESFSLTPQTIGIILFSLHAGFLVTFFLRGAMGEELGLRGFALTRLQEQYSPAQASLIIGVAWAGWHIPVLIGRDAVTIVAYVLLVILLSFIFTWIYNRTGQSLLPVMLFHAAQNSEETMEVLASGLVGSNWELTSFLGMLIFGMGVAGWVIWESRSPRKKSVAEPASTPG